MVLRDGILKVFVFLRIVIAKRRSNHRYRPAARFQCSAMSSRIYARCEARRDDEVAFYEFPGKPRSTSNAVLTSFSRSNYGHAWQFGKLPSALVVEQLYGMTGITKTGRVISGTIDTDAEAFNTLLS